ncbi:unnamed protein product, partial [Mesorhabditis belari]|uniref:Uncharacterized protein n=1 Tax=Mesorhabditis belari TaxID=2138241 RepID=A0AAF3EI42_9BILA
MGERLGVLSLQQPCEYKTPRWKTDSAFLERLMRTEHLAHFPRYIPKYNQPSRFQWMVKMFLFEWTDRRFEMLLTIFTFASIQIYGELDKHEDITQVDCETLEQWAFVIEQGIWYMDQVEAKKEERWMSDEEMIQCLQQMDKMPEPFPITWPGCSRATVPKRRDTFDTN